MANTLTTKLIVKNLPEEWTTDYLQNFFEVVTSLFVKDDGLLTFCDVKHTALLTLEEPVTDEAVQEAQQRLRDTPFSDMTLEVEAVTQGTCSLLVHLPDSSLSHDHLYYYFDNAQRSGCGAADVDACDMHPELLLAVIHFSLPEGVDGVLAKGNHKVRKDGETLRVEPWYQQFHGPLLEQLLAKKTSGTKPSVTPEPSCPIPQPTKAFPKTPSNQSTPQQEKPQIPPKPNLTEQAKQRNTVDQEACQSFGEASATRPAQEDPENDKFGKEPKQPVVENKQRASPEDEQILKAREEEKERQKSENEIEKLRMELERLKFEHKQKTSEYAEVLKAKEEVERLKSENEKLKTVETMRLAVPSHQLRLLKEFPGSCTGCQVTLLEQEEAALFIGPAEDCQEARTRLLKQVQSLADDSIPLTQGVVRLLETTKGRQFWKGLLQRHTRCCAKVHNSTILCAAVDEETLKAFREECETATKSKICTVPTKVSSLPQFQSLKTQLEDDYTVVITLPHGDSEHVELNGLSSDVELAALEVEKFTNRHRAERTVFEIAGHMQADACRKWFSKQLDDVKEMIRQNGKIHDEAREGAYCLEFECRLDVLETILDSLEAITDRIVAAKVDLNKEFPKYSDRALVVNGLHKMGVKKFCVHLKESLSQHGLDSLGDITLPEKYNLPQLRLGAKRRDEDEPPKRSHRATKSHRSGSEGRGRRHTGHRRKQRQSTGPLPFAPCSYTVGNTTINLKTGDITTEPVQAAVNVVGRDLNLSGTTLGTAFLQQFPDLQETLDAYAMTTAQQQKGCYVVTTPLDSSGLPLTNFVPNSGSPMTTLFHAVLNKMPQHAVKKAVAQLVNQCLTLVIQNGLTSVAFPPLGVGRRFGFGRYTVANAMVAGFQKFLQSYPGRLQNITVVVYDSSVIGRFAEVFNKTFGAAKRPVQPATPLRQRAPIPPPPSFTPIKTAPPSFTPVQPAPPSFTPVQRAHLASLGHASFAVEVEEDDEDDEDAAAEMFSWTSPSPSDEDEVREDDLISDDNDSGAELGEEHEEEEEEEEEDLSDVLHGKFEAVICTANAEDCKEVIDVLLDELKTIFLWHETLRDKDVDTFRHLGSQVIQEISKRALTANVHLSLSSKGLRLCGQKDAVNELLAMIRDKMYIYVQHQGTPTVSRARGRLGLPTDTDRLPSYWKVCRTEKGRRVSKEKALDSWRKRGPRLNSVSAEEMAAVVELVEATWDVTKAGAGKDARNLAHAALQVTKVERLENPQLWAEYCHKRESLFSKLESRQSGSGKARCTPVEQLANSRGPLQTTTIIGKGSPLSREIYHEVNEHYLFHGTKSEALQKICGQGLDFRVASEKVMLGRGVYAAESSTKADQYTDPKNARASGGELTMILMRMLLGEPFVHNNPQPTQFNRPPCMTCSKKSCHCANARLYDSVIDDSTRIFREFVVYEQNVCYPEYFITYRRV